jgi:hypothetical protein
MPLGVGVLSVEKVHTVRVSRMVTQDSTRMGSNEQPWNLMRNQEFVGAIRNQSIPVQHGHNRLSWG